jgi:hypothetical protein
MEPHSSIQVVRRWCVARANPVHERFDNLEGLKNEYLPSGRSARVHELANRLRLGTIVPSQDMG